MKPGYDLSVQEILKRQQERRLERTAFFGFVASLCFGGATVLTSGSWEAGYLVGIGCICVFGYISNHLVWWRTKYDK